ncbi:uncharacterized protein H6S33_004200 [Morchella sextelata]|uniref:uncharacterized protein n=1 Tax=Morchella sextelata TaxID=1174677 RepID=UPI001D037B05|nr:uncharacterized protein H6S33_004200 [Morchella sextelata]KAH0605743.1 hypothetical protein H6S33_004200 [Morchella sextelata]
MSSNKGKTGEGPEQSLALARGLFWDMIRDSAKFKDLTDTGLRLNKLSGRKSRFYWLDDKKIQLTAWEEYQKSVIDTYNTIEDHIGKSHTGCEDLKAAMDIAFDKVHESQKLYDEYSREQADSF